MKILYITVLIGGLFSCANEDIEPKIDKLQLMSGGIQTGKHWRLTSFITTSNYCTGDISKFQTTDHCQDYYPESIKDNTTIIFPDGEIQIDEGIIKYNEESPQVYIGRQFWTINDKQDSVSILDHVGLPSLNSTWGLGVSKHRITLTHQDKDIGFRGSLLTMTVTFHALGCSIESDN